jgi:acetylornithine/N-succinyldiaminopimelate aminotransferase
VASKGPHPTTLSTLFGLIVEEALNRGLLINSPRKNTLRFMPALNVSQNEIKQMTAILEKILESRGEWSEKK